MFLLFGKTIVQNESFRRFLANPLSRVGGVGRCSPLFGSVLLPALLELGNIEALVATTWKPIRVEVRYVVWFDSGGDFDSYTGEG